VKKLEPIKNVAQPLRPIWLVAIALFICWALNGGMTLGARWESMTHPTKGVVVTLKSGKTLRGELTNDWSGNKFLIDVNGMRHPVDDFQMMTIPSPEPSSSFPWRRMFPAIAIVCVLVLWQMHYVGTMLRRSRQDPKNKKVEG
jgi:hypothetical protein